MSTYGGDGSRSDGHESHAGASRESDDGSRQARQVRTAVAARDDRRVELVWLAGRTGGAEVVGQGVKERGVVRGRGRGRSRG